VSDDATILMQYLDSLGSADAREAILRVQKVARERDEYKKLVAILQEAVEKLKRGLLGQKAERLPSNDEQLTLAMLRLALGLDAESPENDAPTDAPAEEEVAAHTRKKAVRKPFPEHLPRVEIELLPEEVKRAGLDAFERIGQDTREVIERRPASAVVVRLLFPKFVRKETAAAESVAMDPAAPEPLSQPIASEPPVNDATQPPTVEAPPVRSTPVLVAETPELPIARGTAGPAMLADTIIRRWADHQPLHRLQGIYARDGLELAKSTLCTWHDQLRELAEPLVEVMCTDAKSAPYLCVDATGVLVQAPERCKHGHFWVMVDPGKHVLFRFSQKHDSKAVDTLLAGYAGYLVADAHAVYDHLFANGTVTEVSCWSHGRRYFFKALESDPERAKTALVWIGALFKIERALADAPRKKKETVRGEKSAPIVNDFFAWCERERDLVLDESPISTAIGYAINQQASLRRFLADGRLPLHNNISELQLRHEAVGRKNWLFVGSEEGAKANATFVSLIASCRMLDIEPLAYIRDLLCLLPSWPKHRLLELAPAYWKGTLQQSDAQQRLDANVFRRVALGLVS
jgi:transposase